MSHNTDNSREEPADRGPLVQGLFLKHSNAVRGYLLAFSPDLSDVDDLLQAVFVAVSEKAAEFQPGSNFLAWVRAVARIEWLRRQRERSTGLRGLGGEVIESLLADAPELDTGNERIVALAECLEELSPHVRQALVLRYGEAHKPAEIARLLSIAKESVYVMLSRARAVLRDCIQRRMRIQGASG